MGLYTFQVRLFPVALPVEVVLEGIVANQLNLASTDLRVHSAAVLCLLRGDGIFGASVPPCTSFD